jgi:hypothetical protein
MAPSQSRSGDVQIDSLVDAKAFALSDDAMAQLLAEQFECTFCWTNGIGEPVALTEAFVYADGAIWMCAEESRVRVKAIVREPRSCVVVSSMGTSMGHSKTVRDRERIMWFLTEIAKRYDPHDEQAQKAHVRAADHPGRVVIKFVPTARTNAFDGHRARRRKPTDRERTERA